MKLAAVASGAVPMPGFDSRKGQSQGQGCMSQSQIRSHEGLTSTLVSMTAMSVHPSPIDGEWLPSLCK